MKTILKYYLILLLLAGLFAFAACNKEEQDPFAGKDSYITAFSLQQGEAVFHAAIAGDVITITVPENFSLAQAKAIVKLSENARIYPDPAAVTNWDEERQFAVTAHNGAQTTYKYTVKHSGIAHDGTVLLETQADVDAFGQQGITFIDGNLTIGRTAGTDSITSLAPLAGLKEVVYNLTIQPTFAGKELTGLESLERVGGTFQAGGTTTTTGLKHLEIFTMPALKTVGSFNLQNTVTFIIELPELVDVSKQFRISSPLYKLQVPSLKHAGTLTLTTVSNSGASLANVSLPALETVDDVLSITLFHSVSRIDLTVLKKTGGLTLTTMNLLSFVYAPKLEEITGTVNLLTVPALTEFGLPELKKAGTLYLAGTALNVVEFPKLTEAATIDFRDMPTNVLAGLTALQTAGTITLYNTQYTNKLELPASVQRVTRFAVEHNTNLPPDEIDVKGKNIGILELKRNTIKVGKIVGDEVFNGALVINLSSAPTSPYQGFPAKLEGFRVIDSLYINPAGGDTVMVSGIREVRKGVYLNVTSSGKPYHFGFPDLEEIGGSVHIHCPYMINTTGKVLELEKLRRVGGDFFMNVVTKTVETLRFPELVEVGGNFTLCTSYNSGSNYIGFKTVNVPKLITIGGSLIIRAGNSSTSASTSNKNTGLTNLDGFSSLASVGSIEIKQQSNLVSYEGLKEAFKSLTSPSDWSATGNGYNPTYQDLLDGKWTK